MPYIFFCEGMTMDYNSQLHKNGEDICLADSATTHTILRDRKFFSTLVLTKANVTTISGSADLIEGSGRAHIRLTHGTQLYIQEALYSSKSRRNLLSFKDIRLNGYHIETTNDNNVEYLCITSNTHCQRRILEKLVALSCWLYHTTIKPIEAYHVMNQQFRYKNTFMLWDDRLGHPGSTMMRRIITNSNGHPLLTKHIGLLGNNPCKACSQGKLVIKPSHAKIDIV